MSSLGWNLGRAALWASLAMVALVRGPQHCIFDDSRHDIPSNLDESAFDSTLYHQLQAPYRDYACLPRHIHLSQASNVDERNKVNMTISFTLEYRYCQDATPRVVYGHEWHPEQSASGEKTQFNFTSSLTGEYYDSDWIYHVALPDLQAGNVQYWYRISVEPAVGANARTSRRLRRMSSPEQTPELRFTTPPTPGSSTTIALIGDLGQTVNSTKTMSHIHLAAQKTSFNPHPVSLVMIVGDMSYADSDPHRWPSWFELMEPLLRSTPVEVAAGNHEIECDDATQKPFLPYEHYFRNANRLGPAEIAAIDPNYRQTLWNHSCSTPSAFLGSYNFGNAFYQFQHGLVQIIVLSSYSDTRPESMQYKWLEGALRGIDRSVTPWVLVGFHCPLYTTFLGHNGEHQTTQMKKHMEPLFVLYGVNLIVAGHDHAYSRSYPVAFDKRDRNEKAPIYLTLGAGGNRELHSREYLHPEPEEWVAKRDRFEYGYGNWFVQNATHSHFNWVRDGTTKEGVHDHVWIVNPHV
jgi:hypothetical protein